MSGTKQAVARLLAVLRQERALLDRLHQLADSITDALLLDDLSRIVLLETRQAELCMRQAELERARVKAAGDLARVALSDPAASLSELIAMLPENEQMALQCMRQELLAKLEALRLLNERNRTLLEDGMRFVQEALDKLATAVVRPASYGTNLATVTAPAFFVDSKA